MEKRNTSPFKAFQEITMYKLPEQFASANQTGVETLVTLANAAFGGVERLAALNLNAVRSLLEDGTTNARTLVEVKDAQGLVSLRTRLAQPVMDKASVYSRSLYQIVTETQEALSEVIKNQVSERFESRPFRP
jgi:phasin family protein